MSHRKDYLKLHLNKIPVIPQERATCSMGFFYTLHSSHNWIDINVRFSLSFPFHTERIARCAEYLKRFAPHGKNRKIPPWKRTERKKKKNAFHKNRYHIESSVTAGRKFPTEKKEEIKLKIRRKSWGEKRRGEGTEIARMAMKNSVGRDGAPPPSGCSLAWVSGGGGGGG